MSIGIAGLLQLVELVQRLDQPVTPTSRFEVFPLKHASAAEVKSVMPQAHAHPDEHDELSGDEFRTDYRPDEHQRPVAKH